MSKKNKAPAIAGAYFVKQVFKKGGKTVTKYRNKNGQFVSAEKVEKSSSPVFQYRKGELIIPEIQNSQNNFSHKELFSGEMFFSSIRPAAIEGLKNGGRMAIKSNGKIFEITENNIPYFESFLSDYFRAAKRIAEKYGASPIVQIRFVEYKNAQVFDFDEFSLMDEEILDEAMEGYEEEREFNLMKGQLTKVKNKYYSDAENRAKNK